MNFAIPYSKNFRYNKQPNVEWNILFKPKIKELINFIEQEGSHRINLLILNLEQIESILEILKILNNKYPDNKIVAAFPSYSKDLESKLVQNQIPHYYLERITDWDKFNGFLSLEVTDIIVAENLAFSIEILSKKAKDFNKSLRLFPNVCQSSWEDTLSLKTFFIRPEDLYLYEDLIDTVEFFGVDYASNKSNVYYEAYCLNQKWFGKLNEIIIDYKGQEDNRFISPPFGSKRLSCGKKCAINNLCHFCDKIASLGETLKEKKLIIRMEKIQDDYRKETSTD